LRKEYLVDQRDEHNKKDQHNYYLDKFPAKPRGAVFAFLIHKSSLEKII
jgi:hypothetical protein